MQISSFEAVLNKDTEIFIIGTMPSQDSLKAHNYYANVQNVFWPFIKIILGVQRYDYAGLLKHKIGLWDALKSCTRQGSLDSNIREKIFNDFSKYPQIKYYLFTSKNAYKFFVQNKANKALLKADNFAVLPSPSPAYALLSKSEKLKIWQKTFKQVLEKI